MKIHADAATTGAALPPALKALTFYQQELKQKLPAEVFQRHPGRVVYFIAFLALNIALIGFVLYGQPAWYLKLLAALMIGQLNAGLGFFAHETLHGSVVKNKWLQDALGLIAFAPYLLSPTYWRFWHNTLHHGNTQLIYKDPDAFPTLSVYKRSKLMRVIFELSPGSKNLLSYAYLFYWFSLQAVLNQTFLRFRSRMWQDMDHTRVSGEFLLVSLMAGSYLYVIGAENFLWLALIPFLVQNYVILSYITTNHNISPLTKINDPLVNSLTVTTPRFWSFLHLNFGYHVEHHLFPRVSPKHAERIHQLLKDLYPHKYLHMPKWRALKHIYLTPRIYKNHEELIHPKTQQTYSVLPHL